MEIIAAWDPSSKEDGGFHRRWASNLSSILASLPLPGGYVLTLFLSLMGLLV
jgi:hypothetical protein